MEQGKPNNFCTNGRICCLKTTCSFGPTEFVVQGAQPFTSVGKTRRTAFQQMSTEMDMILILLIQFMNHYVFQANPDRPGQSMMEIYL